MNGHGKSTYEPIQCDLAEQGILDRISLSPSETRVCFEFQAGFDDASGRTLYVADFDAKNPAITRARPIANEEGRPIWCAFPRWSKDETTIIYQADGDVFLHNPGNSSTTRVPANDSRIDRAKK